MPAALVRADRVKPPLVESVREPIKVPILLQLIGWVIKTLARLGVYAIKHPAGSLTLACSLAMWHYASIYGPWLYAAVPAAVAVLLAIWRQLAPGSFRRLLVARLLGAWSSTTYRPRWHEACEGMKLGKVIRGERYLPRLLRVRTTGPVDTVTVRMLAGQTLDDWLETGPAFAAVFNAHSCRITQPAKTPRNQVALRFLSHDPLVATIPPFPTAQLVNLDAVPVAVREEGHRFTIKIRGCNLLFVGEPGGGKSSAIQALVAGLAPAIKAGTVQLHGIDMKGGVELTHIAPLCARLVYESPEHARDLLKEFVEEVLAPRLVHMRKTGSRLHEPTVAEPQHVVIIDELAAITAYVTDNALRKEINYYLALVLSQGRAAGVTVVAGVQDARKAVVELRGLFTYRVAFRLSEAADVDMVLSRGARNRGARCDEIPASMPGVAYVDVDGEPIPARLRFPYYNNDAIAALVAAHKPAPRLHIVTDETTATAAGAAVGGDAS